MWLPGFGWNVETVFFLLWLGVDIAILVAVWWLQKELRPLVDRKSDLLGLFDSWTSTDNEADLALAEAKLRRSGYVVQRPGEEGRRDRGGKP